jgi:hypothetical protein
VLLWFIFKINKKAYNLPLWDPPKQPTKQKLKPKIVQKMLVSLGKVPIFRPWIKPV